ncbi:MAG: hypothetical protein ACRYF0_06825 [Janthinobacterium lividum]
MRFVLLLLLLVCLGQPGFGQGADLAGEKQTTFTMPTSFPLLMLVNTLPQRPFFDDSLARRYYVRNRVKTVTLLRLPFQGTTPDTINYTELDRAGNAVRITNPLFKQSTYLRYSRRHQLISSTSVSKRGVTQTVFDPATKTTTTRVGPTLATLALYQTGHASQHGNTTEYEAFLLAVPQTPPPPVSRILLRNTVVGGDTLRIDVLGYRNEQVVMAESYYGIGRYPQQREGGIVVLPTAGRPHRSLEGRYIPNQLNTYNAAGWLIRNQSLPALPQLAMKPVTQTSADGNSSVTTGSLTDTITTIYTRNAAGQLLREEIMGKHSFIAGQPANLPEKAYSQRFSTYDYLPNGLRSKSDKQGVHYEYRYTFY